MQRYHFFMPTQVLWGNGMARKTGEILKSHVNRKVLIVTDQGVRNANLLEGIEASLTEQQIEYAIFDEVEPNPSAQTVQRGTAFLQENGCDSVLAVGGGSSIDTAKAIAALGNNEGDILDYEGVDKLPHPALPLFAIPTTAGTGSEVSPSTVITNKQTAFKAAVISPYLYPKVAILDAELTLKLPPALTAATGMDALTHAIESYLSKAATPVSQALARKATEIIGENLLNVYFVGTDLQSRENMLVASMMAGAAFAQSRLGNVHAISHTLGGVFNIPHGIANAALLPFVMKYNLPACAEKMKEIAAALGRDVSNCSAAEGAMMAIEAVREMNAAMGIPNNIKDLGVSLEYLPQLVEDSMRSGNVLVNPRLTTPGDIKTIIENAYHGNFD